METFIELKHRPGDPPGLGWEVDCHAVVTSYQPLLHATAHAPAEGGLVDFHLSWSEGGPQSDFLMSHCSLREWEQIAAALVRDFERRAERNNRNSRFNAALARARAARREGLV